MGVIKFGTDGWRAIMCEDFTFSNVEYVTQGICNYLYQVNKQDKGIVIGYDARFFSDRFAQRASIICNGNGIKVYLINEDSPTPVTAFSILLKNTAGAIMFTASHNPPEYNGIKFIPDNAAPALPEVTNKIEKALKEVEKSKKVKKIDPEKAYNKGLLEVIDPTEAYMSSLKNMIDISSIKEGNLKVIYDPLYSTGRHFVPKILGNITDFTMIHGNKDPYFGGKMPNPSKEILETLKEKVIQEKAHLGLANDGDADRFGVIDSNGNFISPNEVISLIYLHLLKNRGMKGSIARTVATTHLLDKIAEKYGFKAIETPVGFKYIGKELLEDDVIIGGEESGGLSIKGHIPEKDGILALSLIAEIRAIEKKSLTDLLQEIYKEFGNFYHQRLDLHSTESHKKKFFKNIKENPLKNIGPLKVIKYSDIDGVKFYLEDGSWVLYRPSGTEPLTRIYIESNKKERLSLLTQEAEKIFKGEKTTVGT